jgi:HEAT repeat protein
VWALGQLEDKSAVPELLQALKDNDVEIRRQAAGAGTTEDERCRGTDRCAA